MKDLFLFTHGSFYPLAFHSELFLILLLEIKFVYQHNINFTLLKSRSILPVLLESWITFIID